MNSSKALNPQTITHAVRLASSRIPRASRGAGGGIYQRTPPTAQAASRTHNRFSPGRRPGPARDQRARDACRARSLQRIALLPMQSGEFRAFSGGLQGLARGIEPPAQERLRGPDGGVELAEADEGLGPQPHQMALPVGHMGLQRVEPFQKPAGGTPVRKSRRWASTCPRASCHRSARRRWCRAAGHRPAPAKAWANRRCRPRISARDRVRSLLDDRNRRTGSGYSQVPPGPARAKAGWAAQEKKVPGTRGENTHCGTAPGLQRATAVPGMGRCCRHFAVRSRGYATCGARH